jgi:lactoylglutathione lyase
MAIKSQLDHVSMMVSDLETTARFFIDVLGFTEIENGTGVPGIRWFGISGSEALHITQGDMTQTRVKKNNHFALRVDDLNTAIAELDAKGVRWFDWMGVEGSVLNRPDGFSQIYVEAPDGYWVEINNHR